MLQKGTKILQKQIDRTNFADDWVFFYRLETAVFNDLKKVQLFCFI